MITAEPQSKFRRRFTRAAVILAAGALALSACASSDTPPGTEGGGEATGGDELTPITAVTFLPLESFTFTPEMYAYSSGCFERHGLDVQLQPVQGTAAAIQSLLGGAALVTRASTVDVFPAMEQGQDIRAIGTMAYKSNLRMISTDDDPITSPEDMEGTVIGMGSVGGTSEKMLDLALGDADVPKESVTRQAVPVTAATLEVVRQGQLDGYIVSLDTSLAISQQNDDAVADPAGLTDAPDIQTWLTTAGNLEDPEKVDQLEAYLAAIGECTQEVIDDAPNGFANVLKVLRDSGDWTFPALEDDAIAEAALDIYTTETWVDAQGGSPLLMNNLDAWQSTYDTYVDAGMLEGGHDPLEWITNEHVRAG